MDINFNFDHSLLSIVDLQSIGIRSTRVVEEAFYDSTGKLIEIEEKAGENRVFFSIGFSNDMRPIKSTFELKDETLLTLETAIMDKADIKNYYCGQ